MIAPAKAGSFQVLLESAHPPDPYGQFELERGLRVFDEVFDIAEHPHEAVDRLRKHKGHLATSYVRLINVLKANDTGMSYGWAPPKAVAASKGGVSGGVARRLANTFSKIDTSFTSQPVFVEGWLETADHLSGSWAMRTSKGIVKGKALNADLLRDLRILGEYRFECIEEIRPRATGNDRIQRFLLDRDSISWSRS